MQPRVQAEVHHSPQPRPVEQEQLGERFAVAVNDAIDQLRRRIGRIAFERTGGRGISCRAGRRAIHGSRLRDPGFQRVVAGQIDTSEVTSRKAELQDSPNRHYKSSRARRPPAKWRKSRGSFCGTSRGLLPLQAEGYNPGVTSKIVMSRSETQVRTRSSHSSRHAAGSVAVLWPKRPPRFCGSLLGG
jgi:hypothetical protein